MIKVNRGRKIVFNPTQYESVEVFASITLELEDISEIEGQVEFFDQTLTDLLQQEIDEVAAVTTNSKSIVHEYRFKEESK